VRQRKLPEDFRLRWRCASEVKEALRPYGGPAAVGSPETIPVSHWYKAQAGDLSSVVYRFCCALLALHNAGAWSAIERLSRFVEAFRAELMEDGEGADLERLIPMEMREDWEADQATYEAAREALTDPDTLLRLAEERKQQGSLALAVAWAAERRARHLRRSRT
jgi:hypothetical protein